MNVRFIASSMVALLAVSLGYGIVLPLAPELATRCGVGKEGAAFHTGAMSAAYLFAFAGVAPVWGLVADRARPPLVAFAGLVVFAATFALVGTSRDLTTAYVLLVVAGVAASAVFPSLQVGAHTLADETARLRLLAVFGGASFVGWFLGPPLATWIGSSPDDEISMPAITVAALGLLGAVLVALTAPAGRLQRALSAKLPTAATSARTGPSWPFVSVAVAFGMGSFEVAAMLWGLDVARLERPIAASILVEWAVMMVATQAALLTWPRLRPAWATSRVAGLLGVMVVTNLAMTYSAGPWLVFAATAVMATAATVLQVMVTSQVLAVGGPKAGWALGLQIAVVGGGQAAGSLLAGVLFSLAGMSFYAGAAVLTVVIAWVCIQRRGRARQCARCLTLP